jgi:hypothetical protein
LVKMILPAVLRIPVIVYNSEKPVATIEFK